MTVLVTGANGFIGGHVCRRMASSGAVRALVRPGADRSALASIDGLTIIEGDVTAPESLARAVHRCDSVVHLAGAVAAKRTETYFQTNTEGTRALAVAARAAGVDRFVYVSSIAAQGPSTPNQPHVRGGDERPVNDYGRSKLEAEHQLRRVYDGEAGAIVLRPGIVHGTWARELATWCRLVARRLVPVVPDLELSFVHVDDLVELIEIALRASPGAIQPEPYFVSDGEPLRMETVVDALERVLETGPVVRVPLSPGWLGPVSHAFRRINAMSGIGRLAARTLTEMAAPAWTCSPELAVDALGFRPTRRFEGSIRSSVEWFHEQGWI